MKPIEYIGARPTRANKRSFFGGWVIVLLAAAAAVFFGRQFSPVLFAAQGKVSDDNAALTISRLSQSDSFGDRLAAEGLKRTLENVAYDRSYYTLAYPGGDIPADRGMASDVIIRAYRGLEIDLQQLVHKDMKKNFQSYPQIWNAAGPDHNIDHRRVPNLQRFFARYGEECPKTRNQQDYQFGDVVCWFLANGETHTGIIVPGPGELSSEKWVVHNIGAGPVWADILTDYQIIGHYRYDGRMGKPKDVALLRID